MKSKLCYEKLSSLGLLPKLTLAAVWGCMLYLHDPLDLRSSSNKAQISTHTAFSVIPRTFQRHVPSRLPRLEKEISRVCLEAHLRERQKRIYAMH